MAEFYSATQKQNAAAHLAYFCTGAYSGYVILNQPIYFFCRVMTVASRHQQIFLLKTLLHDPHLARIETLHEFVGFIWCAPNTGLKRFLAIEQNRHALAAAIRARAAPVILSNYR